MMRDAIVFVGMVYPWGLIRHFALLGVELFRSIQNEDFYFASISREPDRGTWDYVRQMLPATAIVEALTFQDLVISCEALFARHNRVVIHCGGGWGQTRFLIPLRRKYGKRLVLVGTTHSFHIESWRHIPMSLFQCLLYLKYYDKIVFQCSYAVKKFWGARLLFAVGKGVVIPLGCEPFGEVTKEVPRVIARKPGLAEILADRDVFKVVYLAGFRPGKMHVWLVEAFAELLRKRPNVRLLLCGTGRQEVIDAVKSAIERVGLCGQILLTGQIPRDEVPWLLKHANCAVVPSRAETFGHNFLEPMFAGLPVLGTRVGIGCDIISDGETGYGFSLSDQASVRAGAKLILSNVEKTREMGRRAKMRVERDFTHAAVAQRLANLYRSMLNG